MSLTSGGNNVPSLQEVGSVIGPVHNACDADSALLGWIVHGSRVEHAG